MPSKFVAFLAAVLLMVVAVASSAAQTPAPEGCGLSPLALPLFDATPIANLTPEPFEPIDAADVDQAEVDKAVATIIACIATGDPAYAWAVFTPRYLADQFADPSETYLPQLEQSIAEGEPEPVSYELLGTSEVTSLGDGRVSVVVEYTNGISTFEDTLVLARVNGTWLIDDVVKLDPDR